MSALEIFEAIAEDNATVSYLARLSRRTWIVVRRARTEEASRQLASVATTALRIVHANVVHTLDPGPELRALQQGALFEEYVHGDRLEVWRQGREVRPLPWRVAAAVVRDAALGAFAVQSASQGDPRAASELWPGRLVVGFDGVTRMIDPCAELRGVELPPALREWYCAPELEAGGPIDASAAVYALGRILDELCTRTRTHESFVPPKTFERILQRATQPVAADRHRNPSELAIALDALLDEPNPVRGYYESRRALESAAASLGTLGPHKGTLESAKQAPASQRQRRRRSSGRWAAVAHSISRDGARSTLLSLQTPRSPPSSDQIPIMVRQVQPPASDLAPLSHEAPNTDPMPISSLAGFDDYDEAEHDELLLPHLAGPHDLEATLPLRLELLAKLQHDEHVVLENGGERVAVAAAPVRREYVERESVSAKVVVLPPPVSGERARGPSSATVLVRQPPSGRSRTKLLVMGAVFLLLLVLAWILPRLIALSP